MGSDGRSATSAVSSLGPAGAHGDMARSSAVPGSAPPLTGRSLLDSDALASSDDEQDAQQAPAPFSGGYHRHQGRRPSWINEGPSRPQRQPSYGGSEIGAQGSSSHISNVNEPSPWTPGGSTASRGHSSNSSFPWGNAIWNSNGQKSAGTRLGDVLPSPTSVASMNFAHEPQHTPPLRRDSSADAAIPFAIPLHPTLKAYRSQSYSVGQLDQEVSNSNVRTNTPQYLHGGRTRAGSTYAGLQHRSSRPTMFGDFSPDTSVLGQLREVDDDDETSTTSSEAGFRMPNQQARTIEKLAMENAILRQQALMNQGSTVLLQQGRRNDMPGHASANFVHGAEGEAEEADEVFLNSGDERQAHDYNRPFRSPDSAVSDRQPDAFKKRHWQSSLGFTGVAEPTQSRRHSFADVPLRHQSVGSTTDVATSAHGETPVSVGFRNEATRSPATENSFFSPTSVSRPSDFYRPSSSSSSQPAQPTGQAMNKPLHFAPMTAAHQQQPQSLYVVTFKAARAEIYYVHEGTGLEVNAGDLVIVEADRGTDLGTVAHKDVDWASAKQLKERYVAEHYNWLMMFSRQGQNGQGSKFGPPAHSFGSSVNAIPSKPSMTEAATALDPLASELKPKMIKRLAQTHEIHSLREKEGNEAKAKRMCQQKVAEHHLSMEILDAEFQMDWKKLTFYYFADAYVNFNPLVTDLFKIYKTRIWMSAINPASFATPSSLPTPNLLSTLPLDRERSVDPHARPAGNVFGSVDYHGAPRGPVGPPWNDVYGLGLPNHPNAHHYSQLFHTSASSGRYPSALNHAHDVVQGTYVPAGAKASYGPMAYHMSENSAPGHVYNLHGAKERRSKAGFDGQLSSLQNLSLGT